ncbi:unnamed protein product [Cunninghamella blakesleeana]
MTPKTYTQQRAVLRPNRNVAFFDDDDFEDDIISSSHYNHHSQQHQNEMDAFSITDDGSSFNSVITNTDTLMLAQFLANTGPEEFLKPTKQQQQNPQFHRASRLFNKLRKKGGNVIQSLQQQQQQNEKHFSTSKQNNSNNSKHYTNSNSIRSMKSHQSHPEKKNYIPLPVYQPSSTTTTNIISNNNNNNNNNVKKQHQKVDPHHDFLHPHDIQLKPSVSTSSSSSITFKKRNLSISSSSSSHHTALRDSGIYSETSDKCGDEIPPPLPSPPMIPSKSYYRVQPTPSTTTTTVPQQPKRPAPLPPAVASAAIASATTTVDQYTSMDHSSFYQHRRKSIGKHPIPSAALKRKSITRIRHIQVQTDPSILLNNNNNNNNSNNDNGNESHPDNNNNNVCKHCKQHLIEKNLNNNDEYNGKRRTSCPSVLPTGQLLEKSINTQQLNPKDAIQLLSMIEQLKLQLVEEQKSRLQLEEIIQRQFNGNKL